MLSVTGVVTSGATKPSDTPPSLTSFTGVVQGFKEVPHVPSTLMQMWNHGYESFNRQMQAH